MNDKIDWEYLRTDTRARVYFLWAALLTFGFVATHYYQYKLINGLWTLLSAVGIYYMYRVMPLKVKQMKHIFVVWALAILVGMAVSGLIFYVDGSLTSFLISHLGAFWLLVMAVAYALNGWVDPPATWYWFAAGLNGLFGVLCFMIDSLQPGQYLIAAVVSAWSMLYLWLYRT